MEKIILIEKLLIFIFLLSIGIIFLFKKKKLTNEIVEHDSDNNPSKKDDKIIKTINKETFSTDDYKKYLIYITPKILDDKYNDISHIIYEMEYLYIINTELFESLIKSFNYFIVTYEDIMSSKSSKYNYSGYEIELLMRIKKSIIEKIGMFTYSVKYDELDLINEHLLDVKKILSKYTLKVINIYNENLKQNGYDVETKIINDESDPIPAEELYIEQSYLTRTR